MRQREGVRREKRSALRWQRRTLDARVPSPAPEARPLPGGEAGSRGRAQGGRHRFRQSSGRDLTREIIGEESGTLVHALVPGLGGGVGVAEAEAWDGGAGAGYVG